MTAIDLQGVTKRYRIGVGRARIRESLPYPLDRAAARALPRWWTKDTFHAVEDFNCKPNRGGTAAPLFQINHWIETTPTPKPSNAAIVNAHDFLLARARQCQKERGKLPNILAVDFALTGDVVAVAAEMNGVAPAAATTVAEFK